MSELFQLEVVLFVDKKFSYGFFLVFIIWADSSAVVDRSRWSLDIVPGNDLPLVGETDVE
jgi:hypothetical protein